MAEEYPQISAMAELFRAISRIFEGRVMATGIGMAQTITWPISQGVGRLVELFQFQRRAFPGFPHTTEVRLILQGQRTLFLGMRFEPGQEIVTDPDEPMRRYIFGFLNIDRAFIQIDMTPIHAPNLGLGSESSEESESDDWSKIAGRRFE